MPDVISIAGSPSDPSKSSAVLHHARSILERHELTVAPIRVRELPPEDLIFGRFDSPALQRG